MTQARQWSGRLKWSLVYGLGAQLPVLVGFVVLARYIAPDSFGTMATAWLIAGVGQIFLLETVGDALVRRAEVEPADRDTTFWASLALSVVLAALTAASAPAAARLFDDPVLLSVLPVLSVRLLFDGLTIVPDALLRRGYAVRALAVRSASANVLAAVAAVALAVAGWGIWALVAQQVVLGAVNAAVAWSAAPFRPGLPRRRPLGDVLSYFANASLYRSVDFSSANLDRFLVGKFRGMTDLGYYSVAQRIQLLTVELVVGNVLRLVALPYFATASRQRAELKDAFLKSLRILSVVAFPCAAGFAVLADSLVPFVFGSAWIPAVPVVQILLVEALVLMLAMLHSALLRASGQPQRWLFVQVAAFPLGALLMWAAVHHAIVLVALAALVKGVLVFPLHWHLVRQACGFTVKEYAACLGAPAVATAAMAAAVGAAHPWLETTGIGTAAALGSSVMVGVVVYAGLLLTVFRGSVDAILGRPLGRVRFSRTGA